jgi:hypothetical protein
MLGFTYIFEGEKDAKGISSRRASATRFERV